MTKEEHVIELAQHISSACEVLSITGSRKQVLSSGENDITCTSELSHGTALRIIRHGKLGTAACMMTERADELVEMAICTSGTGPKATFSFAPQQNIEKLELIDPSLTKLDYENLADITDNFKAEMFKISPFAKVFGSLSIIERTFNLLNSNGFSERYSKNFMEWDFQVFFPIRDRVYSLTTNGAVGTLNGLELWKLLEIILLFARNSCPVKPVLNNSIPVILSPNAVRTLLQTFKAGAGSPFAKMNPLLNLIRERIAPEQVTISDLPRLLQGPASAPFDAEGIPTANRTLIDKGIFTGFIYDIAGATHAKVNPTGNAGRNLNTQPQPVCTNLVMEPGVVSFQDMVGSISEGIILTGLPESIKGDILCGEFAFDTETALYVCGGEIVGCVDNLLAKGNFFDVLANIFEVGNDLFPVGTDLLPFISTGGIEFNTICHT